MDLCSVVDEDVLQDPWAPLAVLRQPLGPGPPEEVELAECREEQVTFSTEEQDI